MVASMTGFARTEITHEPADDNSTGGAFVWEMRSVNHRYLDIHMRIPDDFRALEPAIREAIGAKLKRGKVEVSLRFNPLVATSNTLNINEELLGQLLSASVNLKTRLTDADIQVVDLLRWPGVLDEPRKDLAALRKTALKGLTQGIDELVDTRHREGERIKAVLVERCEKMTGEIATVKAAVPEIKTRVRERLQTKLDELNVDVDQGRLEQELVLQAQRLDVDEEVDRLTCHIQEINDVLDRKEPIGRRLDFLMQECNREANTIASKAQGLDVTNAAVELKVLLEQLREQIQNVE